MPFDLEQARKDGISDEEIANYLADRHREFNISKAKADGVTSTEIADYLAAIPEETSFRKPREPSVPQWGRENPNLYGAAGAGKELYRQVGKPLIEAGGMIGGAALGGVPGAGLGYGIAKEITDMIEGNKSNDLKSGIAKSAKNVAEGMTYEMGGQAVGAGIGKAVDFFTAPSNAKMTPEAQHIMGLAKQYGIKLSPADVTGSKTIGLVEALLEKMPGSTDVIRDFRVAKQLEPMLNKLESMRESGAPKIDITELGNKIYNQVDDYLREELLLKGDKLNKMRTEILARLGTDNSLSSVGLEGKELILAKSIAANERAKKLYEGIDKFLPAGQEYETPNLKRSAEKLLNEYSKLPSPDKKMMAYLKWASGEADQIPKELQAQLDALPTEIKAQYMAENPDLFSKGMKTWDVIQSFRREVSGLANKQDITRQTVPGMKFQTTPEGRVYTILKNAADKDLHDIAEATGGKAWARFKAAQAFYGKQAAIYKSAEIRKIIKSNPEDIIDVGFKPNGVTEVRLMKSAAKADGFLKLRQGFTNKLLGVGKNDTFDPKYLRNQINKYGDEMLTETFGKADLKALKNIADNGLKLDRQQPGSWILKRVAKEYPDTVVDSIIGAPESKLQSNTLLRNVQVIRKTIGVKESKQLSEHLFEKLMQKDQITGMVRPVSFAKMVDKYSRILEAFYSKAKVNQLRDLATIGKRIQTAEIVAGNPSGTGQTLISWGIFRMLMRNPITGAALAFTPKQIAKLYASDFGIKWLTQGFKVPVNSKNAMALFTKLSFIIGNQSGGK